MRLKSNLWLSNSKEGHFGKGRIELLEKIADTGSISKAAKAMHMSYKAAWDAINEMNRLSDTPIVRRITGGKGGGGTALTEKGREYIEIYHRIEEAQEAFFGVLGEYADDIEKLRAIISRPALRTSARNQIEGKVTHIALSRSGAEVALEVAFGEMTVHITRRSLEELDIKTGKKMTALFKPGWVEISAAKPEGADVNWWCGKALSTDADEVIIDAEGERIVAVCRSDLAVSENLYFHIDPSNALLAV